MRSADRPINIGLIGLGTVGREVAKYFLDGNGVSENIKLKKAAVTNIRKHHDMPASVSLTTNVDDIIYDPNIDIVVELMGQVEPTRIYLLDAMLQGKSIVTANKALLSRHMKQLFDTARDNKVNFGYEASVGGSMQNFEVINRLKPQGITIMVGVLNGTCNDILTNMAVRGLTYESALKEAQKKDFTEQDPSRDVEGFDTQDKVAVLASVAWNMPIDVDKIPCRGIKDITKTDVAFAKQLGYKIKLLGIAEKRGQTVDLRVTPTLIKNNHPLAEARNEYNKLIIKTPRNTQSIYGEGAGGKATSTAVISDISHFASNIRKEVTDELPTLDSEVKYADLSRRKQGGYIRVGLINEPGSFHHASGVFLLNEINLKDSIQWSASARKIDGREVMQDLITFYPAPYEDIETTLIDLEDCTGVYGKPLFIPIATGLY